MAALALVLVGGHRADGAEQEGTCRLPTGETISARVNDERGGQADGVRVFACPRRDPFIMDFPAAQKTIATGKLAFTDPGAIFLDGKNILSLVVEVACARLPGGAELFGVFAETLTRGGVKVRLERAGRPEVANPMLAPKQFDQVNRDLEIRDLYNMEDAFRLSSVYGSAYRARLNANLAFWDGKTDWPAMIRWVGPLRTDGLVSSREEGRVVFCWLPHGLNGRLPDESVLALGSRAPCRREGGGRR